MSWRNAVTDREAGTTFGYTNASHAPHADTNPGTGRLMKEARCRWDSPFRECAALSF